MVNCKDKLFELLNELEKAHPDLYKKNTKEVIEEFINKCPDKCSNDEFLLNVLRLTSIIGDPHTIPIFDSNAKCVLKMTQDGVYISNSVDKNIMNCKLVSINGISIQKLSDIFMQYIRYDNQSRLNVELCDLFANELFLKKIFGKDIVFDLLDDDKHIMYNYTQLCNSPESFDKDNTYFYDENNNVMYIKIETLDPNISNVEKIY